jgi:hypothetical protein
VSKHSKFDPSSQVKHQAPTTPLSGLCEKKYESTNVVSSVVNMEGVKGFFLSINYFKFRDHDLVGGFHNMWSMCNQKKRGRLKEQARWQIKASSILRLFEILQLISLLDL